MIASHLKWRLAPLAAIAVLLAACQRAPTPPPADLEAERRREEQIQALDERLAQLQDLERQARERELTESQRKAVVSEQERQRLEKEKQALLREREQLAEAQRKAESEAVDAQRKAEETARSADQEREERTMDLFYTALDPHGEWMDVDQYGYVWRPSEASDPRWRPYTDGQWVFSEYGWTWKSNEPFGWAVYHYGRWARLRRLGWIWVPGTEWGPGWVSWRRGDRYVGWAPLPPEAWSGSGFTSAVDSYYEIGPTAYTFVPVEEIGQPTYVGRAVAPQNNVTIVNQTVNVTNIHYTKVKNKTVVFNGGLDLSRVNERARQKVPRLHVEHVTDVRSSKELGRAEQRGDTLVVAAPHIVSQKTGQKPLRATKQVKAPEIDRGWTDVDKTAATQVREQMKKEARQTEERQRKGGQSRKENEKERSVPSQRSGATPVEMPRKTAAPAATPAVQATPSAPQPRSAGSPGEAVPAPKTTPSARQRPGVETAKPATPAPATPAATPEPGLRRRDRAPKPSPATPIPATPVPAPASDATVPGSPQSATPPARQRPGVDTAEPATPAPATPAATPEPDARRRDRAPKASPATPISATPAPEPSPDATVPGSPEPAATPAGERPDAAATPERRVPKAKRPRPGASESQPGDVREALREPSVPPEATPGSNRRGQKKREREDAAAAAEPGKRARRDRGSTPEQ